MILSIQDPEIRLEIAIDYLNKGKIEEATFILEEIKNPPLSILLFLLECYDIQNIISRKIETLIKIIEKSPEKKYFLALIKELKNVHRFVLAFSYAIKASKKYPYDPDFKKEIIEILLKKEKYHWAFYYFKKNQYYFEMEKRLFYQAKIYLETGRKWRAFFLLKKMTKQYPFNIFYRYLLSTLYQSFGFIRKSETEIAYIKDFLKNIPKLMQTKNHHMDPMSLILQQILDEVK